MMATLRSKTWITIPKDQSISELMQDNVSNTPHNKVIYEDSLTGKHATYGGFHEQLMRSAYWLKHDIGLLPGQIVTIVSPSCIDYLVVIHAVWWIGGIVSQINNALNEREIRHALDIIRPDLIVPHDSVLKIVEAAATSSHSSSSARFFTLGAQTTKYPPFQTDTPLNLPMITKPFSLRGKDASKICASIVLSSGTTGNPKAVMLSHYNLVSTCKQLRADNPDNWRRSQREIFFPPLSHIYGVYVCATMCLWVGAYVCMLPRFDIELYCRLMHERRATLARLVPPIAKLLAEHPAVARYTYPSLEYFSCSAAPLKTKLATDLSARFPGVVLAQTYGCTELSGPIVQSGVRDAGMPLTATGTLIANIEMLFVNEEGQSTASGPGEITIRAPNVMMGYKDNAEASAESLTKDGWYHTGDVGHVDEKGYLYLNDRTKDIIKYKGFQVSPGEVEEVLFKHPDVQDVAVCGIWSDEESTELPRAFIVLRDGANSRDLQEEATQSIKALVSKQLSNSKQLRGGIAFLDMLPRNPTGKILRRLLRAGSENLFIGPAKL